METKTNRTPVTGILPIAVAVLELGRAMLDRSNSRSFRAGAEAALGTIDEIPCVTLLKRALGARKLFTFRGQSPDPVEVRIYAVTAYLQLMTDYPCQIRWVTELVGHEDCGRIMEARQALYRLCRHGTLSLRDAAEKPWNCYVALSPAGVAMMGLRRKDAPVLFTSRMINATAENTTPDPLAVIPTPGELAAKVNQTVLGMPEIVARLSCQIVMHMRRARLIRDGKDFQGLSNTCICLIGESGCGKTLLIHEMGRATGLPFGSSAAPDYSITGFVGLNSDDALKPVHAAAGNNLALARHGICHLDEWDKLRPIDSAGSAHISTTGVVHSFLRLIEGAEVMCNSKRSSWASEQPSQTVSTVGTCFAFSGVFKGLRDELKQPLRGQMGFVAADGRREGRMLQEALCSWGMPREWVNRLSLIQFVPSPSLQLLMDTASGENGVITAYNRLLADGKSFALTEEAVRRLAAYALESKGYVRAVKMAVSRCCEIVLGNGQSGRTEFGLAGICEVIDAMEKGE